MTEPEILVGESLEQLGVQARAPREVAGARAPGTLVHCDHVVRIYMADGVEVQALQGLDLTVAEGELTAVVGVSGSGKSTLLRILGGLDQATAGTVEVAGRDLAAFSAADWLDYHRRTVGFVWQKTARNLVPYLTAAQNVALPMKFAGLSRAARRARALELLEATGVAHCRDRTPQQLSGGEQQRTAIATACANNPRLLLADEPTGELDSATANEVFAALRAVNNGLGTTILIVTHDESVCEQVPRTVAIRDGRISTETLRTLSAADAEDPVRPPAVEYAVLDRAGRLQLPERMVSRLSLRDRVRLEDLPDHIAVWPGRPDGASDPDPDQIPEEDR